MLEIDKTIEDIEGYFRHMGYTPKHIKDAIKVLQMWKALRIGYGELIVYCPSCSKRIKEFIDDIEDLYFPPIIHQTYKVTIKGIDDKSLHKTRDLIKCVDGVEEVKL